MSVNLGKGQKVSLTKGNPGLSSVVVGFGWSADGTGGVVELDASAFLLTASGKVSDSKDFVFYGNLTHPSGSVVQSSSVSGGDKQQIKVELAKVPGSIMRIAFSAAIYDGESRGQSFVRVRNAYIRIFDAQKNTELVRYDLSGQFTDETAVVFGELYKNNGEWKFNAMGTGIRGGLAALCGAYGIEVG